MSKHIKLTEEMREQYKEQCRIEFATAVDKAFEEGKFPNKFSFSKDFGESKDTAEVYFTVTAWSKMLMLIHEFSSEVAWHGVAERIGVDGGTHGYRITDILVYPQTVSGATVEMDEVEYAKWQFDNREDERFDHIHMQGHSHVNMNTFPSGVDTNHQDDIMALLPENSFYIFMIYNKRLERWYKIYDNEANLVFENRDVTVKIEGEEGLEDFIKSAKESVKPRTYTYPKSTGGYTPRGVSGNKLPTPTTPTTPVQKAPVSGPYNPVQNRSASNPNDPENRPKTCFGSGFSQNGNVNDYDDDDYYSNGYGGCY